MRFEKKDYFENNSNILIGKENYSGSLFSKEEILILTENEETEYELPLYTIIDNDPSDSVWKILIADDEKDVITITKLALKDFKYKDKKIMFFEAYNKDEAKKIFLENNDIALIYLDVVMQSNDDGLELVRFIREDLKNELVQIVLRTGQPGYAPEKEIISNYKINFYQSKSELTENKLFTLTASMLNTYQALHSIREYNRTLKKVVAEKTLDLRVKNEEYKNAINTKNKMFSIIAHDLVNPFNSLLGFSDILRNQCENLPPEKIKQFSEVIWQTSRSTCDLLSNLLDWSRVQTGKISYSPQKTSIPEIIQSNIELLRLQARQKKIQLSFDCNYEIFSFCDRNMINTVIRNLISNGIKFTGKGGVMVSAYVIDGNCKIDITDTGVGISQAKIKELFNPDTVSMLGTAGESGTGIGLMLCNEFIHLNHGQISVISKINSGSTFTLTLPIFKS
jgi:two-component system, sensor histidine kinase and response regulator